MECLLPLVGKRVRKKGEGATAERVSFLDALDRERKKSWALLLPSPLRKIGLPRYPGRAITQGSSTCCRGQKKQGKDNLPELPCSEGSEESELDGRTSGLWPDKKVGK